jgi:hypothetical protein
MTTLRQRGRGRLPVSFPDQLACRLGLPTQFLELEQQRRILVPGQEPKKKSVAQLKGAPRMGIA